ncbi:MAG: DUF1559 domain-containing protein [Pirellulales bacterium]|nr:DUF1559 domain-containing protein [Pirellulales bacterium]
MSIRFTCPHCGLTTHVADQYAGQSGPCRQCGRTVVVPASPEPASAPPGYGMPLPPKRKMGTGKLVLIILACCLPVLLICGGFFTALTLPAIQAAREAARRAACTNNLKQIGMAMHNYYDQHGTFPPAFSTDKDGKPLLSWRVLLLPYMEEETLYQQFNLDEPWDSPHNLALASQMPQVYRCLSDPAPPGVTSYAMLVGPHAISDGPHGRKISEIWDGLSNTVMVIEVSGANINWTEPRDIDVQQFSGASTLQSASIESNHPGVVNTLFGDGSVQSLPKDLDPKEFESLTTVDGGEPANRFFND